MPDIGDTVTETLTVTPHDVTTAAAVTVYAPDGTVSSPAASTSDGGATWRATFVVGQPGWWLIKWQVTGAGAGVEYQRLFVPVSPVYGDAPAYAAVERLRRRLGIQTTDEDDEIAEALDSGAREIDSYCGRVFWSDTTVSARVFRPVDRTLVVVDDFWDPTGMTVTVDDAGDGSYSTTWTRDVDYVLEPFNGVVGGSPGWPYWRLLAVGSLCFPVHSRRPTVRVATKWGWRSIPRPVTQANLIIGQANYKLRDVAFGAAGIGDLGIVTVRQVPAAMAKLAPFVRDIPRIA